MKHFKKDVAVLEQIVQHSRLRTHQVSCAAASIENNQLIQINYYPKWDQNALVSTL